MLRQQQGQVRSPESRWRTPSTCDLTLGCPGLLLWFMAALQFGAYLSEHEVRSLNQEQLDQLQKLRQEAEKAFGPEEATFPKLG